MNELKLYFIPYPNKPNSSSLGYFFIVKFLNEIPNFLKIAPFARLPISQYEGFLLETSDFLVGRVLSFRLRLNMVKYKVYSFTRCFYHW